MDYMDKMALALITERTPENKLGWKYLPPTPKRPVGILIKHLGMDEWFQDTGLLKNGVIIPELRNALNALLLPVLGREYDASMQQSEILDRGKRKIIQDVSGYIAARPVDDPHALIGDKIIEYSFGEGDYQGITIYNVSAQDCRDMEKKFHKYGLKIRGLSEDRETDLSP